MSCEGVNLGGTGMKDVSFFRSLVSEADGGSEKLVFVCWGFGTDWEEHFFSTYAVSIIGSVGGKIVWGNLFPYVMESRL